MIYTPYKNESLCWVIVATLDLPLSHFGVKKTVLIILKVCCLKTHYVITTNVFLNCYFFSKEVKSWLTIGKNSDKSFQRDVFLLPAFISLSLCFKIIWC